MLFYECVCFFFTVVRPLAAFTQAALFFLSQLSCWCVRRSVCALLLLFSLVSSLLDFCGLMQSVKLLRAIKQISLAVSFTGLLGPEYWKIHVLIYLVVVCCFSLSLYLLLSCSLSSFMYRNRAPEKKKYAFVAGHTLNILYIPIISNIYYNTNET